MHHASITRSKYTYICINWSDVGNSLQTQLILPPKSPNTEPRQQLEAAASIRWVEVVLRPCPPADQLKQPRSPTPKSRQCHGHIMSYPNFTNGILPRTNQRLVLQVNTARKSRDGRSWCLHRWDSSFE